jgi:hypothetical protein
MGPGAGMGGPARRALDPDQMPSPIHVMEDDQVSMLKILYLCLTDTTVELASAGNTKGKYHYC